MTENAKVKLKEKIMEKHEELNQNTEKAYQPDQVVSAKQFTVESKHEGEEGLVTRVKVIESKVYKNGVVKQKLLGVFKNQKPLFYNPGINKAILKENNLQAVQQA